MQEFSLGDNSIHEYMVGVMNNIKALVRCLAIPDPQPVDVQVIHSGTEATEVQGPERVPPSGPEAERGRRFLIC